MSVVNPISFAETNGLFSIHGWKKDFSKYVAKNSGPSSMSRESAISMREFSKYLAEVQFPITFGKKSLPPVDLLNPHIVPSIYGIPLGGIGCGTIGRGYKGEFCRSSLVPGRVNYGVGTVDQFILTVKKNDKCVYSQVLSTASGPPKNVQGLHSWKWSLPPETGHYVGLYPCSWTAYYLSQLKLLLICKQISPIIPDNYKDSCLPVGVFHWTALNFDLDSDVEISITMTWRGPRSPNRPRPPNVGVAGSLCSRIGHLHNRKGDEFTIPFNDSDNQISGCLLETLIDDMPCCFGLASKSSDKVTVSRCVGFRFGCLSGSNKSKQNAAGDELGQSPWGVMTHKIVSADDAINADKLWTNLSQHGHLPSDDETGYFLKGKNKNPTLIGIAVCASFKVAAATGTNENPEPGQEACDFFLTWHMPMVHFRSARIAYKRRYTRWFSEDTIRGASELLIYASNNARIWEEAIEAWQNPILNESGFPAWYKSALFNELYFLSDGGTVWLDPIPAKEPVALIAEEDGIGGAEEFCSPLEDVRHRNPAVSCRLPTDCIVNSSAADGDADVIGTDSSKIEIVRARMRTGFDMGLFAYLEGHEYRFYNTYDVHFNASWALLKLWPRLQLAVNYDLADMTASEDQSSFKTVLKGFNDKHRIRSSALAVPHDCGDPEDEPWYRVNAYNLRATDEWKDLNPKFVLMVWRDWKITSDNNYLLYMLPLVVALMENDLKKWDKDDDGLIENSTFPDQTYDMWASSGLSAYTGSICLAALYATKDMISYAHSICSNPKKKENYAAQERKFEELLTKAKSNFYEKLWIECGYLYNVQESTTNPTIMADQICGHWVLRMCGAPVDAILPENSIPIVLDSVVSKNWRSVLEGKFGAINGIRNNGKFITSNMQANEFWVGINYCLASLLILEGMTIDGFDLCGACYKTIYEELGLQFQTPEAYTIKRTYRSTAYMRPLAVWSIQHAVEMRHSRYNGAQ